MNNKGMTLIEVIIAMAILSIVILGMLSLLSSTMIGIIRYGDETETVFASQEQVEYMLNSTPSITTGHVTFEFNGETVTIVGEETGHGEIEIFNPE